MQRRVLIRLLGRLALAGLMLDAAPGGGRIELWAQNAPSVVQQEQGEAGGPAGDSGAIALPKKKDKPEPPPEPEAPKFKNPEGAPNFTLRVDVPEVVVDVGVLVEKTHSFLPGLKPSNFRIYEDGAPQTILGFKRVEEPITALLLCEFASTRYAFVDDMHNAATAFAEQLRPQDEVALMTFDLKTHLLLDFTQDKDLLQQAINSLTIPGYSETNVYDALYESLDRLSRVEGRKYIVLVASGLDSFSRITFDKILQKIRATPDVTIYTVSTGGALRALTEGMGGMRGQMRDLDFLMADNQMRSYSELTGGMSFFPRFSAEAPEIFQSINQSIRMKYQLVYRSTNTRQDGGYRKLRVALIDDLGQPLQVQDQKRKPLKYQIIVRDGYRARQQVE